MPLPSMAPRSVWWSVLACVVFLPGCGGSPQQPSPPPPPPPGLSLTCPADLTADADETGEAVVDFETPAGTGGVQPLTVTCEPASGTKFKTGASTVECTARDAANQSATCRFGVEVAPYRRLSKTRFLAFGDSITEGFLREPPASAFTLFQHLVIETETYPYKLDQMLRERYRRQEFVVFNRGVGGETLPEGRERIVGELLETKPDVLLLFEGYNDIRTFSTEDLRKDLRSMVRSAQVRGADVIIATLFQISDQREAGRPGVQQAISDLNGAIRRLAAELKIEPVVDLEAAFAGDASLLGSDGLHPTAQGYTVIAERFFDAIVDRYEDAPPPPTP